MQLRPNHQKGYFGRNASRRGYEKTVSTESPKKQNSGHFDLLPRDDFLAALRFALAQQASALVKSGWHNSGLP